ncbi:hypothetical protein BH23ACI1_BH23ACI1_19620 [soil metagenome]|nr:hypothetical protein [Acidobacteriota bacterium]
MVTTRPQPAGDARAALDSTRRLHARIAAAIALAVLATGTAAALHYAQLGLTTSHYDARAHLVVARRIFDSLTPGWPQIGAVWLPLPHLLNMLPVQVDAWYRSGFSAVVISILSMSAAAWGLGWLILRTTGSVAGACTAAALIMVNPNVLYLQSTPMTEPLLFGTTVLGVALTAAWLQRGAASSATAPGLALVAACLTRYEAWPITGAILALACAIQLRDGATVPAALRACARLALYPAVAIAVFSLNSKYTVGEWFTTGGFFVPENVEALGHPLVALRQVREGLYLLSGTALVWSAYAGTVAVVLGFIRSRAHAPLVLVLALAGAAALPWYAYVNGHPFRIRYDLPLVVACAAIAGAGIALLRPRIGAVAGAVLVALAAWQAPPLDRTAPLIRESQLELRQKAGRALVTNYLQEHHDGRTIMMSMGSLAHYMHDLSHAGFAIRDFLHEGNGEAWWMAMSRPRGVVGWILVEERAEGGDTIYWEGQKNAAFFDGFERVAEGGNVGLYRWKGKG